MLFLATTRHAADDDESMMYCHKNDAQLFRVSGDSKACKRYTEISKTALACRTRQIKVCKIEKTHTNKKTKLQSPSRDQNAWVSRKLSLSGLVHPLQLNSMVTHKYES